MEKILYLVMVLCCAFTVPAKSLEDVKHGPDGAEGVVILGGGVGALTAAIYLGRAGIVPLVIEGRTPGGAITQSYSVQNWPGEMEITGFDLSEKVRSQAKNYGANIRREELIAIDLSKRPFLLTTKDLNSPYQTHQIIAENVIIAMGATPHYLDVPGEKLYWSTGVYTCAICDGGLYKDKVVAVVGGGDSALLEAQYLSNIAKKVYLIVRKETFRTVEEQRKTEVLARKNVEVLYKTVVQKIEGDGKRVTQIVLQRQGASDLDVLSVDGVFLAIGARPNTDLFRSQIELDPNGYVVLKQGQRASKEGVYASGDVADPFYKQAIAAAGDAAKAALEVQNDFSFQKNKSTPVAKEEKGTVEKGGAREIVDVKSVEQFDKELASSTGLVFIDFYTPWCTACRQFLPTFEEWSKTFSGESKFIKVDAGALQSLSARYGIQGVPTLIVLDSKGNIVRKSVGTEEIADAYRLLNNRR